MTTPILLIEEVANDTNQYIVFNQAIRDLESSVNDELVVDLSSGDASITNTDPFDMLRYGIFTSSGNTVAREITFSANQRIFQVQNGGSAALDVTIGSTTLSVPAGEIHRFYADGTTNGLIKID